MLVIPKNQWLLIFALSVPFFLSCARKAAPPLAGASHSSASASTSVKKDNYGHPPSRSASYRDKPASTGNLGADLINMVNDYRHSRGLPPLRMLNIANTEASRHSQDMAVKKVPFGHSGFSSRALHISTQLQGTSSTGENVAYGRMTAREVVQAWLKSPPHRQNMEGAFTYTGVGVARDAQGFLYYTQLFVKK